MRIAALRPTWGIYAAKRARLRVAPVKKWQHQHNKRVSVKWSFGRRLCGYVRHTRLRGCADGTNAARATIRRDYPARRAGLHQKGKTSGHTGNEEKGMRQYGRDGSHSAQIIRSRLCGGHSLYYRGRYRNSKEAAHAMERRLLAKW
jgi:hypothetical protein